MPLITDNKMTKSTSDVSTVVTFYPRAFHPINNECEEASLLIRAIE